MASSAPGADVAMVDAAVLTPTDTTTWVTPQRQIISVARQIYSSPPQSCDQRGVVCAGAARLNRHAASAAGASQARTGTCRQRAGCLPRLWAWHRLRTGQRAGVRCLAWRSPHARSAGASPALLAALAVQTSLGQLAVATGNPWPVAGDTSAWVGRLIELTLTPRTGPVVVSQLPGDDDADLVYSALGLCGSRAGSGRGGRLLDAARPHGFCPGLLFRRARHRASHVLGERRHQGT
jgi:hypothetical protein